MPGYFDVAGVAPGATVTVTKHVGGGPQPASRNGLYFFTANPLTNTSDAVYAQLDITDDAIPPNTGEVNAYVAETPESFNHDDDGNLEGDGRWLYTYDAENRLITMETDST